MRAYYGRGNPSPPTASHIPSPNLPDPLFSMRKLPLTLIAAVCLAGLPACVYVAPISQGNVLEQEDIDQVEVGMTRGQVRFLLGTPMIDDPFHANRWDYVYYLKVARQDAAFKRWISIVFENDRVSAIIKDQELSPDL